MATHCEAILKEGYRFLTAHGNSLTVAGNFFGAVWPSLFGMLFSFVAGLLALRWLSCWLEHGRWQFFGYYCLGVSAIVLVAAPLLHWG